MWGRNYEDDDYEEDEDEYTPYSHYRAGTSTTLRSQLTNIADQWERKKSSEQQGFTTRITRLTREKNSLETQMREIQAQKKKAEDELATVKDKVKEMEEKLALSDAKARSSGRKIMGLRFVLAELVNSWPSIEDKQAGGDVPPPLAAAVANYESSDDESTHDGDEHSEEEKETTEQSTKGLSASQKKRRRKKNKQRQQQEQSGESSIMPPAPPSVAQNGAIVQRCPMPQGLPLPKNLLTRQEFLSTASSEKLTVGQLKRLEEALGGDGVTDDLLGMVDNVLGQALTDCCAGSGSLRLGKLMIQHGASPSFMGEGATSPLHSAVRFGHEQLCLLLLKENVNVNTTDSETGRTALHIAAVYNKPAIAKALIQKGAYVDAVDNEGQTPTELAQQMKWKRVVTVLNDPSVLFWNFSNRATRLYKATEYELCLDVYEKAFALVDQVKPALKPENRATLHYNCARAASHLNRHLFVIEQCDAALKHMPRYASAVEQRGTSNLALYNYEDAVNDYEQVFEWSSNVKEETRRKYREAKEKKDQNYFDILRVPTTATPADVKKAYRQLCLSWHPDKHQKTTDEAKHRAHIMFQRVQEAHETLSDPAKRQAYEYRRRHFF